MILSDVVVIGGGVTGTSVMRDLTLRGLDVHLLERYSLASGTTSYSHQNLVGGLRYVLKDPVTAKLCAEENRIISKIAPDIVGEVKNYYVGFKSDYTEQALRTAKKLNVPIRELKVRTVLKEITSLNKKIDVVVETDDRNIDVIEFCRLNCEIAKKQGGVLLDNTEVQDINLEDYRFTISTDKQQIKSKYVVNATGPWINNILKKLDLQIPLLYSKGTIMIQKSLSPRSLQYLRNPSNADAYIVHNGFGWLGTTSTTIKTLDEADPEPFAEEYLRREFSVILPDVVHQKTLKVFTGVRPLFETVKTQNGRQLSRNFKIIEKPNNFFNIVGGKLTLARLMAEKTVDSICHKENVKSRCKTHIETLSLG
jgi:glycerol-3-phosphate dehydrogenase